MGLHNPVVPSPGVGTQSTSSRHHADLGSRPPDTTRRLRNPSRPKDHHGPRRRPRIIPGFDVSDRSPRHRKSGTKTTRQEKSTRQTDPPLRRTTSPVSTVDLDLFEPRTKTGKDLHTGPVPPGVTFDDGGTDSLPLLPPSPSHPSVFCPLIRTAVLPLPLSRPKPVSELTKTTQNSTVF